MHDNSPISIFFLFWCEGVEDNSSMAINESLNDSLRIKYHYLHLSYLLQAIKWVLVNIIIRLFFRVHSIQLAWTWIDMILAGKELMWEGIMCGHIWMISSGNLAIRFGSDSLISITQMGWKEFQNHLLYGSRISSMGKMSLHIHILSCTLQRVQFNNKYLIIIMWVFFLD